jgi:hypothetical protein
VTVPTTSSIGFTQQASDGEVRMEDNDGERGSRAALAGAVFALLFVAGWLLLQQSPPLDAPADELADYYTDPDRRRASLIGGLYVVPFGGIAFMWFMAALRDRQLRSGAKEHVLLSTVQIVAGTMFVMAIFAVAAIELALVWMAEQSPEGTFDADVARVMVAFGAAMAQIVALRSGAVFIASSTTRAMRSGLFPRWYGVLSMIGAALLLFSFTAWPFIVLVLPFWVLASSGLVLTRRVTRHVPTGS